MASPATVPITRSSRPLTEASPLPAEPVRRWPGTVGQRWMVRAGLGLPIALFALIASSRTSAPTANDAIATRSGTIHWGVSDLAWVNQIWPPIPVGVAGMVRGNTTLLAVIGAACAGGLLHSIAERLVVRGARWWLVVVAVVVVATAPATLYLASANLPEFLGLVFTAMAMSGFLRFVQRGRTEGGFAAGLLLGLAAACHISAVGHALAMAAAAPMIAWLRYRGRPGAGRATAAVLVFPTLAAVAAWGFLEWRFSGTFFHQLEVQGVFTFADGVWPALGEALRALGKTLLASPVFLLFCVIMAARSVIGFVGFLMPLPGLVLSWWFGVRPVATLTVTLITCLALFGIPDRPSRRTQVAITAALVAQAVLTMTVTLDWMPTVGEWWASVT